MKTSVMKGMIAGLALAASAPVFAGGSANVSLTSDYLLRGVTQSDNKAALQGGYDYDFDNGFALGIWGSNVAAGIEYDLYGSYSGKAGDMGYKVAYFSYNYTDATFSPTLTETLLSASYMDASLSYYIGDGYNYMELGYGTSISGVGLGLTYGSNSYDGGTSDSNYSLAVDKDFSGYDVALKYTSYTPVVGDAVTATALSVSKGFDL